MAAMIGQETMTNKNQFFSRGECIPIAVAKWLKNAIGRSRLERIDSGGSHTIRNTLGRGLGSFCRSSAVSPLQEKEKTETTYHQRGHHQPKEKSCAIAPQVGRMLHVSENERTADATDQRAGECSRKFLHGVGPGARTTAALEKLHPSRARDGRQENPPGFGLANPFCTRPPPAFILGKCEKSSKPTNSRSRSSRRKNRSGSACAGSRKTSLS